ncbi:hypothetical protein XO10_01280 [Marinitoga sp. 1135]|uniref:hypothetical protein n=1 Tax=unclassified Marinitoga TaxID=2640159 RepID=UPI000950B6A6|nr:MULTISPECIES: hypothetical protein [unclassified Marinitoga]APT75165.1 hypothetical protein LN42_01195 [Marinitoga sp. 1137]NUU94939.1 hypothetical protein [Marinitoga sp. 1135]
MRINPDAVNPILGYKLDPGEPGLSTGAPASLSILRVLSQETSNLVRFKAEAAKNGGYIIYSKISLDMEKRGAFLAAVAGKTEVKVAYKKSDDTLDPDNSNPLNPESDKDEKNSLNPTKNKDKKLLEMEMLIKRLKNYAQSETDPIIKSELEEKIRSLENQLIMMKLGNTIISQNESILGMIFSAYF